MTITKELLEQKIAETTKKRDQYITAANGAIAEMNAYVQLLAEFDAPAEPEAVANVNVEGAIEENTETPAEVA
jgi:hypothetical protein